MKEQFKRTALIIGQEGIDALALARIAIFGIGGVGGYVAEALARAGIGEFTLIDNDIIAESNINRQLIALHSTIGRPKADVMSERIYDINPAAKVEVRQLFYLPENSNEIDFARYNYIVDALDTVAAKLTIAEKASAAGVPLISCMGTGNKLEPSLLRIADISETSVCPLARVMRKELKHRNIEHLKVLYSTEKPISRKDNDIHDTKGSTGRPAPGSISFVPSVAGLMIAGEVVRNIYSM